MTNSYIPSLLTTSISRDGDTPVLAGTKRKRGVLLPASLDGIVSLDVQDASKKATSHFKPVAVIDRAQLPLSFLEPSTIIHRRFYIARDLLQSSEERAPVLLVETDDGRLHAIEHVHGQEYALCRVSDNTSVTQVLGISPRSTHVSRTRLSSDEPWWKTAVVMKEPAPTNPYPRKAPHLSMLQEPMRGGKETEVRGSVTAGNGDQSDRQLVPPHDQPVPQEQMADSSSLGPPLDREQICGLFVRNYLEMLYKSLASTAYFAKAHASRLRTAYNLECSADRQALGDFLSDLVLSSNVSDRKFKTTWPAKVQELGLSQTQEQTEAQPNKAAKKNRKSKTKWKQNKQGLLPDEESMFEHWWNHGEELPASVETTDTRFKRRTLQLRTREAFLQIIVMLEALALQPSGTEGPIDSIKKDATSYKPAEAVAVKPNSRPVSTRLCLDLLVDKLCIWHSLHSAGLVEAADGDKQEDQKSPDQLSEFCVDVIIPFYSSRVPELAMAICNKFGGPSASPSKPKRASKTSKIGSSSRHRRFIKDDSQQSTKSKDATKQPAATLSRSYTDSALIPGLKREASETPLSAIPLKLDRNSDVRRASTTSQSRLRQREVDFHAMSQAQETRRKKQADVEAKLKEAISALKKPNRGLAGKEMADVAAQRELMAHAREKAAKAQRLRQRAQSQIDATPTKRNRTREDLMLTRTPEGKRDIFDDGADMMGTLAGSTVPSSGIVGAPRQFEDDSVPQTGHRQRHVQIDLTPVPASRSFMALAIPDSTIKSRGDKENQCSLLETPVKAGSSSRIKSTPTMIKPPNWHAVVPQPRDRSTGFDISTGPSGDEQGSLGDDQESTRAEKAKEDKDVDDIYSALGWD